MISSQKDSFLKAYGKGKNFIPIIKTWPADLETPLSTWLKLSNKDAHGVFLESVLILFGKQFALEKKQLKLGVMEKVKYLKEIPLIY